MRYRRCVLLAIGIACIHLVATGSVHGQSMPPEHPIGCEAVEKAVTGENLRAVAAGTDDPDLLLGLAYLAKPWDPVRPEISRRVVELKPEYDPIVAVLAVALDGADDSRVGAVLERDPGNALGHYLQANLLRAADRDEDALDAFRRGAKCRELRLYENVTGEALFKALDALELKGRDRLCALSWVATNVSNFYIGSIQRFDGGLSEIAHLSPNDRREEISDLLLILAGQLYATNFDNRWYARRALQSAFRLKAEVAALEDSPKMNGYAAVTQALVSTTHRWPDIADSHELEQVVPFVPARIHRAFFLIDPERAKLKEEKLELSPDARAAYEQARQNEIEAAEALIEAAMENPDEIVGAYLKGLVVRKEDAERPWVSRGTYVERAMSKWPEVFKAAVRNEQAMQAVWQARRSDPRHQNVTRMMVIGEALIRYAFKHDHRLPESINVLYEQGYLDKAKIENKSLLSGRPYVYVAANQRLPEKRRDRFRFILLYDDHEIDGNYQYVLAIPGVPTRPAEEVKQRVEAQRK